jgi:hypothetical protein
MISYIFNNSELDFGDNGDFIFNGQDISILRNTDKVVYQVIVDYLRTNFQDYELNMRWGANLKQNIGKGVSVNMGKNIANDLRNDIIAAGLIDKASIDVYSVVDTNTLYLRVVIFSSEDFTAQITINASGVSING